MTERAAKRVTRIDPKSGEQQVALTINEVYQREGQDGLLGMVFHPELLQGKGNDYVYLAYTYLPDTSTSVSTTQRVTATNPAGTSSSALQALSQCRVKIVRYTYDAKKESLSNPLDLLTNLSGSNDHNSGRLPFGPDGKLYASEHGPKSDDEVNLIQAGKNYGWPYVAGYQDDQAYVYANWSAAENCQKLRYNDYEIPATVPTQKESEWHDPEFVPPIYTFGTVPNDHDFQPAACKPNYYICWPTIAPTGLEVYSASSSGIAGWNNSLLLTSLKTGTIFKLELSEDGTTVVGEATPLAKTINRYRDMVVKPGAGILYVITDSGNNTQDVAGLPTATLAHPGALLEFQ